MSTLRFPSCPDMAEEIMLGVIARDALEEAERIGKAQYRFGRYRISARKLAGLRIRLIIQSKEGSLFDGELGNIRP